MSTVNLTCRCGCGRPIAEQMGGVWVYEPRCYARLDDRWAGERQAGREAARALERRYATETLVPCGWCEGEGTLNGYVCSDCDGRGGKLHDRATREDHAYVQRVERMERVRRERPERVEVCGTPIGQPSGTDHEARCPYCEATAYRRADRMFFRHRGCVHHKGERTEDGGLVFVFERTDDESE